MTYRILRTYSKGGKEQSNLLRLKVVLIFFFVFIYNFTFFYSECWRDGSVLQMPLQRAWAQLAPSIKQLITVTPILEELRPFSGPYRRLSTCGTNTHIQIFKSIFKPTLTKP